MIIVEGPPSSGKTALAYKLKAAISRKYGPDSTTILSGSQGAGMRLRGEKYVQHCLQRLEDYTPGGNEHIICDEWHWGLPAYQKAMLSRKRDHVQPAVLNYVDLRLSQLGAVIVHRNPTQEAIERRMGQRNPFLRAHPRILQNLSQIRDAYTALSHRSVTTVLPPNSTMPIIAQTAEYIEDQAKQAATDWPWYLGPHNPEAVLIDLDYTSADTLFPGNHSGAFFLHHALSLTAPTPHQSPFLKFGILNAAFCTPDTLTALLHHLKAPKLLALGPAVSEFLTGVQHTTLPHHRKARAAYGAHIRQYGELIHAATVTVTGTDLTGWNPTTATATAETDTPDGALPRAER